VNQILCNNAICPSEEFWMHNLPFPEWQEPYQAALFELDPVRLVNRISDAKTAIQKRLVTFGDGIPSLNERTAIAYALKNLDLLSRMFDCDAA
jgi:hypothetical protein